MFALHYLTEFFKITEDFVAIHMLQMSHLLNLFQRFKEHLTMQPNWRKTVNGRQIKDTVYKENFEHCA